MLLLHELHHAKGMRRANAILSQCPHYKFCRDWRTPNGRPYLPGPSYICDAPGRAFMPYAKREGPYLPEHARSPIMSSPFVSTCYSIQRFCKEAAKTMIRLCEFAGWSGHSLLAYQMRTGFLGCKNICSTHSFSMWLLSNILSLFM